MTRKVSFKSLYKKTLIYILTNAKSFVLDVSACGKLNSAFDL